MQNHTRRVWLFGLLSGLVCLALILAASSASVTAAWPSAPEPTSTPSIPQGGIPIQEAVVGEATTQEGAAPQPLALNAGGRERAAAMLGVEPDIIRTDKAADESAEIVTGGPAPDFREILNRGSKPGGLENVEYDSALSPELLARTPTPRPASADGTSQLVVNGTFETGAVSPWLVSSTGGSAKPAVVSTMKYAGTYSMRMGNELGSPDRDEIVQAIVFPSGPLRSVVIDYYYRIQTTEGYVGYDKLCNRLWNDDGTAAFSLCLDFGLANTTAWIHEVWTLSASQRAHVAGKTMFTGFHVFNDASDASTVYIDNVNVTVTTETEDITCVDLLSNPQVDITELGDGTGTIDFWQILSQKVYFATWEHRTPNYSLVMEDDPDVDTVVYSSTLDIDEFAQGFVAPSNLTYMRFGYSRLYLDANVNDNVYSTLWTLDGNGNLDELVAMVAIGESPYGWNNRYWDLDTATDAALLAKVSGRPLATTLVMMSNRADPKEWALLDDIQVEACYARVPGAVHLPALMRNYGTGPMPPTCADIEPDATTTRGYCDVGATCNGSFSPIDQRDYYTIQKLPTGTTNVRLCLRDLPTGTQWNALIYRDNSGSYPLVCQIGLPGSGDKCTAAGACALNSNYTYFAMVDTGSTPPSSSMNYKMSITKE